MGLGKWFELWHDDKISMLNTMNRNLQADLNAGYNPQGNAIKRQLAEIDAYKRQYDAEMELLKYWDEKKSERWCYLDLVKRGAIA